MREIDLHIHTTESDGTETPREVVRLAKALGLRAVAVTDHDTAAGWPEAAAEGERLGVEVVPGIEISTTFRGPVHILGYYIDPHSAELEPVLDWVLHDRDARNRKMAEHMAADGLPVDYDAMRERFGAAIGRPHFAELLVELGLAESVKDAFDRYVEKGQRYYEPRHFLSLERSIAIIRRSGGVPVLAHPFQYRLDDAGLRELIAYAKDCGLEGMECRYSGYDEGQTAYLLALAAEYGLCPTGGSDFHGAVKPHIALGTGIGGTLAVPYACLEGIREKRDQGRDVSPLPLGRFP